MAIPEDLGTGSTEKRRRHAIRIVLLMDRYLHLHPLRAVQEIVLRVAKCFDVLASQLLSDEGSFVALLKVLSLGRPFVLEVDDIEGCAALVCIADLIL